MIQVGNRYKFIFQVHKILFKVNYFAKVEIQEQKKTNSLYKNLFPQRFCLQEMQVPDT